MLTQELSGENMREKGGKLKLPGLERETKPETLKYKKEWEVYFHITNTSCGIVLGIIIICVQHNLEASKHTEER